MTDTIQDRLRFWRDDLSAPTDDVARDMLKEAADEIDRLEREREEIVALVKLVAMEFKSDPMSVQCFDIESIVKPCLAVLDGGER